MNVIPAFAGLIINNAPDNTNNQVDSSLNAPADDVATAPEDSLNVWQNDQNAQFDTNAMSFTGQTAGDGPNYAINTAPKDTLKQWTNGQNTNPDINTMSFTAQTASILCGLPICGGQTSFYDFGPRDEFSCENEIGKGHESNQFQVVALPSWFMQDGYCGKHLELWWTNPATGTTGSTKAIIGDKCPPESCVSRDIR